MIDTELCLRVIPNLLFIYLVLMKKIKSFFITFRLVKLSFNSTRFVRLSLLIFAFLVVEVTVIAQDAVSGNENIVIPGSKVRLLFDRGLFTEGPAVAPDGKIYFSDITRTFQTGMQAGHIWVFDPDSEKTSIFRSPSGMANGIIFDHNGNMIVAEGADFGGRRITRTDMKTGKSRIVTGVFDNKPYNAPNDLAIDEAGNIYFTDPRYFGHEPVYQPVQGVYRVDIDGKVSLIIAEIRKPNGVIVSPDQKTLYVSEADIGTMDALPKGVKTKWGNRAVYAYDLSPNGNVKFREKLIDIAPRHGVDGMAIDQKGNLYITAGDPDGIIVYSPAGKELAFIPTPFGPRNVTFGRESKNNTLYITAGGCLYQIEIKTEGYHPVKFE